MKIAVTGKPLPGEDNNLTSGQRKFPNPVKNKLSELNKRNFQTAEINNRPNIEPVFAGFYTKFGRDGSCKKVKRRPVGTDYYSLFPEDLRICIQPLCKPVHIKISAQ